MGRLSLSPVCLPGFEERLPFRPNTARTTDEAISVPHVVVFRKLLVFWDGLAGLEAICSVSPGATFRDGPDARVVVAICNCYRTHSKSGRWYRRGRGLVPTYSQFQPADLVIRSTCFLCRFGEFTFGQIPELVL